MTKNEMEIFVNSNLYKYDEFSIWDKTKYIRLKNGICIYPNFNIRFKFSKNKKYLEIIYGELKPFGFILRNPAISYSLDTVSTDGVYKTKYYENCRFPTSGDVIRVSKNGKILAESFVRQCYWGANLTSITLENKLKIKTEDISDSTISFYTPSEIKKDSIIGNYSDGIYLNFIPYKTKKGYHQRISIKKIIDIK